MWTRQDGCGWWAWTHLAVVLLPTPVLAREASSSRAGRMSMPAPSESAPAVGPSTTVVAVMVVGTAAVPGTARTVVMMMVVGGVTVVPLVLPAAASVSRFA